MTMNTRKTIHKVYLAWDFKKEELWLRKSRKRIVGHLPD